MNGGIYKLHTVCRLGVHNCMHDIIQYTVAVVSIFGRRTVLLVQRSKGSQIALCRSDRSGSYGKSSSPVVSVGSIGRGWGWSRRNSLQFSRLERSLQLPPRECSKLSRCVTPPISTSGGRRCGPPGGIGGHSLSASEDAARGGLVQSAIPLRCPCNRGGSRSS